MTVYRRNPLLMTVMGANPGGPSFLVADSATGEVMYTKRATGTGSEAINKCAMVARRLARQNRRSYIVFLDMSRARVGGSISVPWARVMGITEEFLPDGGSVRGNPPRRRKSGENEIDSMIGAAWARFMSGVQVSVMEIPKIFRDIKLEMAAGMTLEDAVRAVGNRYRVNRNPGIGEAIVGGMAGALINRAMQSNPGLEGEACSMCGGELAYLGTLGNREHYRCRACGWETSAEARLNRLRRAAPHRKLCGHGRMAGRCVRCNSRGRGGSVKSNPAIRVEWDRLTPRRKLAVLEFAGIPYEQAKYLAHRSWSRLAESVQGEVAKGWRDTTMRTREAVQANPGSKRKMTMTVERFAAWVKSKRDPKMWRAFLAKFRGYEKWTHGARARRVTVEWIDTPGVNGLWITYDGGKQPESTYIMPKGSPRKGAWKHPWDTMPDIKHDPEAKIVITKLRGKSKITDFYHK